MSEVMQRLVTLMRQLPGIGEKTATRLVLAILSAGSDYGYALSSAISELVQRIHPCPNCGNLTEGQVCAICSNSKRDQQLLCVVEKVPDLMAIEASGEYHGLFHVLGGVLNPLDGSGPEQLRVSQLMKRLTVSVKEVILATPASVEGEATALYLKRLIEPLQIKTTRIASGIPVGGDLEYVDRTTISLALRGRQEME